MLQVPAAGYGRPYVTSVRARLNSKASIPQIFDSTRELQFELGKCSKTP